MFLVEMQGRQAGGAWGLRGGRLGAGQTEIGPHGKVPCGGEHCRYVEAEGAGVGVGEHVTGFVIAGVVGRAAGFAP